MEFELSYKHGLSGHGFLFPECWSFNKQACAKTIYAGILSFPCLRVDEVVFSVALNVAVPIFCLHDCDRTQIRHHVSFHGKQTDTACTMELAVDEVHSTLLELARSTTLHNAASWMQRCKQIPCVGSVPSFFCGFCSCFFEAVEQDFLFMECQSFTKAGESLKLFAMGILSFPFVG